MPAGIRASRARPGWQIPGREVPAAGGSSPAGRKPNYLLKFGPEAQLQKIFPIQAGRPVSEMFSSSGRMPRSWKHFQYRASGPRLEKMFPRQAGLSWKCFPKYIPDARRRPSIWEYVLETYFQTHGRPRPGVWKYFSKIYFHMAAPAMWKYICKCISKHIPARGRNMFWKYI